MDAGGGGAQRALVVDDDPGMRRYLELRLGFEGYTVVTAASAEDALAALEAFDPTVLITDIGLPGMDGLSLCRQVRADTRYRHLPILVLTASERSGEVGSVVGLGLIWYMRKGADWPIVARTLHNLISRANELQPAV